MSEKNQPSLPDFPTRFVGRAEKVERLKTLLHTERLVTVTGISGLGKTRLVVEVARRVGERWRDGARFVSLEGVTDLPAVIRAAVDALALPPDSKVDVREQLSFALSQSEMLLVLDAAENVASDGFAAWITETLRTSPSLRLLATSQQPLGLQVEQCFPLTPMALPEITTPLKRLCALTSPHAMLVKFQL
jgi:non-specific serine/threonine protein kinase